MGKDVSGRWEIKGEDGDRRGECWVFWGVIVDTESNAVNSVTNFG